MAETVAVDKYNAYARILIIRILNGANDLAKGLGRFIKACARVDGARSFGFRVAESTALPGRPGKLKKSFYRAA
jgi:hypothetical protein